MFAFTADLQDVVIKNLNGNTLTSHDKSEHLHLTEDFEVTLAWTNSNIENRLDFGTTIELVRVYTDSNGNVQKPIKILTNLILKNFSYLKVYIKNKKNKNKILFYSCFY